MKGKTIQSGDLLSTEHWGIGKLVISLIGYNMMEYPHPLLLPQGVCT